MISLTRPFATFVVCVGFVFSLQASAETPPTLRVDPFRPIPKEAPPTASLPEVEVFVPVLRSTVAAGERSLANLGGEILSPGESAHGYELLEVNPFDALFLRDGRTVRLEVLSPSSTPPAARAENIR